MIFSYKFESSSAKLLAEALGTKRIKTEGSSYVGSPDKVVINWGNSSMPEQVARSRVLNRPENVKIASNKINFFMVAAEAGVSIPDFTTDPEVAREWLEGGAVVVGRGIVQGHSGAGITLFEDPSHLKGFKKLPLYTKYVPKKDEFRVHIVGGKVIDVRRKAASSARNGHNFRIRTHANGFIFQKNDIKVPDSVIEESIKAIKAVGLDFGAVDVIYNEFRKKAYVLEINTAPGLEGSTIDSYKEAFLALFEANQVIRRGSSYRLKEHSTAVEWLEQVSLSLPNPSTQSWQNSLHPVIDLETEE